MKDAHDRMGGSMKPSSGHKEHHKKHNVMLAVLLPGGKGVVQKPAHRKRILERFLEK